MPKQKKKSYAIRLVRTCYYTIDVAAKDQGEAYSKACDTVAKTPNRYLERQGRLLIQDLEEIKDRWSHDHA